MQVTKAELGLSQCFSFGQMKVYDSIKLPLRIQVILINSVCRHNSKMIACKSLYQC